MKTMIAAAALLFLTSPAWAQDAASHTQHHPQAPSPSTAPSDKAPTDTVPGKTGMKMGMMEHCKMMQEKKSRDTKPMDKSTGENMDCAAMHQKMHSSDSTMPGR